MGGEGRVDGWRVKRAGAREAEHKFDVQGWNGNGNGKNPQGKMKREYETGL